MASVERGSTCSSSRARLGRLAVNAGRRQGSRPPSPAPSPRPSPTCPDCARRAAPGGPAGRPW
jgi:hypothetical protein